MSHAPDPVAAIAAAERRGLQASIRIALALSAVAVVLGIVWGARILVFEGVFGTIGLVMSWLALRASRTADQGPTERYPFGRDALTPLMVLMQGLAMLATLIYAASDAVIVILDGGQRVAAVVVFVYSAVAAATSLVFARWLRSVNAGSDLISAESIQWRGGGVRSLVAAIGAVVALGLAAASVDAALDYVDPVLVLVSCVLVAPLPIRMLRHGLNELLEGRPDASTMLDLERVLADVTARFELPEPVVRSTKLGAKLYVEVVYVMDRSTVTIAQEDEVRRAGVAALRTLPFDVWATIELTTDPLLAQ